MIGPTGNSVRTRHSGFVMLTLVTAAIVGGAVIWISTGEPSSAAEPAQAVPVQTAKPVRRNVPVYLDGLGSVQAENTVNVTSRIDGQIQSIGFSDGQYVKAGDLLAVIDPRPYQASLNQATAKISQAQADLANARYLLQKDTRLEGQQIVTQETLEEQQQSVSSLEAQLAGDQAARDAAEVSLSYTEIRSPINGRTGIRKIDAGNQVHAADSVPIVTITQMQPIDVISSLREDDLGEIQQAMKDGPVSVTATTVDQTTELGVGTLSLIDNEIDQATGTLRLKSSFPNTSGALWPGQSVMLRVRQKVLQNVLTIPAAALQRGQDGFFVYTVAAGGTAGIAKVTVGPIEGRSAVISSGLDGTEEIVVTGQYRLTPGVLVERQDGTSARATVQE